MATTFGTAYRAARLSAKPRKPRVPLAVRLGRAAAKALPRLAALRRTVLVLAGFGAIDYSLWTVAHAAGYAAAGVSLLLIDWLAGGKT
jgi:hypothetical protein